MKPFNTSLAFYRTRHRTPGCKLTHMFGIPLLLMVPATFFFCKKTSATCLLSGVALQLIGHYVFEKNEPTLIETHDLMSIPASIAFTAGEWQEVFTGTWVAKNGLELWKKRPVSPGIVAEAYSLPARV